MSPSDVADKLVEKITGRCRHCGHELSDRKRVSFWAVPEWLRMALVVFGASASIVAAVALTIYSSLLYSGYAVTSAVGASSAFIALVTISRLVKWDVDHA